MNFVVYKTNTLKAAKNRIEELLKAVSRSDIDSPHIVIVPDRASLAAERSMLAAVGGSFNIQVFTFNRYAGLIAPETLKPLSGQKAVLVMMKVIEQHADRLVCFSGAGNTEGFAPVEVQQNKSRKAALRLRRQGAFFEIEGYSARLLRVSGVGGKQVS